MHIQIYSKENCPYCNKAARLAAQIVNESSQQNHSYDKYMLNVDFTREQLLEKFPSARTFPQITVDGVSIGGYQEFEKWYNG
jgi:glutaredoxin